MSFPYVSRKQRQVVHASRMASRFAKQGVKMIEASLKKERVTR